MIPKFCRDARVQDRGQLGQVASLLPGELPRDARGEEGQADLNLRGSRLDVPFRIRQLFDLHRDVSLHRVGNN